MTIPNKVRIGNIDYSVEKVNHQLALNYKEVGGIIDFQDCSIKIRTDCDVQHQEQVFLHELVHGIFYDKKIEVGEDEEKVVDSIAMALHQIIRDNPEIFREVN